MFLDPRFRREGPMNSVSSVCQSVCQWRKVLRIGSLLFSDIFSEVKGTINVEKWQSLIFLENSYLAKNGEKDHKKAQKGPKIGFLDFYAKLSH